MASSIVNTWRSEAIKIDRSDATDVKTYLKSYKDSKAASSRLIGKADLTSTSNSQPGKIQKCKKVKNYVCTLQPIATTSSFFGDNLFKKLMDLKPIPLEPPADLFEPCSNRALAKEATQVNSTLGVPDDLETIELQPLDEPTIEHIQIPASVSWNPVLPQPVPTVKTVPASWKAWKMNMPQTVSTVKITPASWAFELPKPVPTEKRTATVLPAVLENHQAQTCDYSQQHRLSPDFRHDLDIENFSVATDFLTPRQDELYMTLDDVLYSLMRKITDILDEIKTLLLSPRNLETIHQINNLMTNQQKAACALQQILSTYSVRRNDGRADPMMNS